MANQLSLRQEDIQMIFDGKVFAIPDELKMTTAFILGFTPNSNVINLTIRHIADAMYEDAKWVINTKGGSGADRSAANRRIERIELNKF